MKKTMPILLVLLGVVVLSVLSSLGTYYYLGDKVFPEQKDTVLVNNDSVPQDQAFTSAEQVLQDRHLCQEYAFYDSVYRSIPEDILKGISNLIIARQGNVTVKDIAEEFVRNYKMIFQRTETVPTSETVTAKPDTAVEREVHKIPTPTTDTVINGQHYQLIP